jgi:hypothetical protein
MIPRSHPIQPPEPAEADIQHAAYFLWEKAGRPQGRDQEFWFAARERLRHSVAVKAVVHKLPRVAASTARNAQPGWPVIR